MRRSKATSTAERRITTPGPQYRFIGGKGGVGKTTCAAAIGLHSADAGLETLVISTDPAPSLSDAFEQELGPTPRPIRRRRRLHAAEVDAGAAFKRWIDARRSTLEEIALRGTWLDRDDVSRLLRLSLPGIDEMAALLQIAELAESDAYQRIVVDTAPTGHLLRMLAMPAVLERLSTVFDRMQMKHRVIVDALRGAWVPDAADALISEIRQDAQRISALLRDTTRARVSWVTLPELMAVEETADGVAWLREHGIAVDTVVVNQMTAKPPEPCRWCAGRRQTESQALATLPRKIGSTAKVIAVPAVGVEPRGLKALGDISRFIEERRRVVAQRRAKPLRVTAAVPSGARTSKAVELVSPETRLVMFGGKGGVGKTTCATGVALDLASRSARTRVLLLSADPAHSLGDVLGQRLSDVPQPIRRGPANLLVRELDAERVFIQFRERFAVAIDELFARDSAVARSIASDDRAVMLDLLELAPPGIDELMAIMQVTETLATDRGSPHDVVVMDTAPTGHALRLIEMPTLVHEWVKALMAILLKYQPVMRVGNLGAVLVQLSRGLGRMRQILSDPQQTRFVAVTRAAALPRAETVRLLQRLAVARINTPAVIVNAVGAGTCSRCRATAAAQQGEIDRFRKQLSRDRRRTGIVLTPAEVPPPLGRTRLKAWHAKWVRLDAAGTVTRKDRHS